MARLFLPTGRRLIALVGLGLLALVYALYVRYRVIQQTPIGLACDAGAATLLCTMRAGVIALYQHWAFGTVAISAAALNLLRPSVILFGLGLGAAMLGIVLYNVGLSALAVALLILSLARPATATASS